MTCSHKANDAEKHYSKLKMKEVIDNISDFEKYLKDTRNVVEEALDFSLGPENPKILRESMRYSLLAGGKRIRPILCLASCSLAGGDPSLAVPTAVSYTHLTLPTIYSV